MTRVRYALTQVEAPATEPLSREETKRHLSLAAADTDEDDLIDGMIKAARRQAESFLGRSLITQTWAMDLDRFPPGTIEVPRPPLQAVENIVYVDADGQTQTLPPAAYRVDENSAPGRLTPAYGTAWPATRPVSNAVTVTFTAGYGDTPDEVPDDVRAAMRLIVGRLYQYREDVVDGPVTRLPGGADTLLRPYRIWRG